MLRHPLTTLALVSGLFATAGTVAQIPVQFPDDHMLPPLPPIGQHLSGAFGWAVTMRDDLGIVGAWARSNSQADPDAYGGGPTSLGLASIVRRAGDSWSIEHTLLPPPGVRAVGFGFSLATGKCAGTETIVVGPLARGIYTFLNDGGQWIPELVSFVPADYHQFGNFGNSLAIHCDDHDQVLIVGDGQRVSSAKGDLTLGGAFIYRRMPGGGCESDPWCEEIHLGHVPGDLDLFERTNFGGAVGLERVNGTLYAAVGASFDSDAGELAGAVYFFRHAGAGATPQWQLESKFIGEAGSRLGGAIAMSGRIAVVGATREIHPNQARGAAYIYRFNGAEWTLEQKLTDPDGVPDDLFGVGVAAHGDLVLVGTGGDISGNIPNPADGSVLVFRFDGDEWAPMIRLMPAAATNVEPRGFLIPSISGDMAVVGAPGTRVDGVVSVGTAGTYKIFNSPVGESITTNPVDAATGEAPATITFAQILSPGTTTIEITTEAPPIPSGFQLSEPEVFYDIQTTATFDGPITICIAYDPTNVPDPEALQLRHHDGNEWVDITSSRDPANNIICGTTSSLSPFAIFQPLPATDPFTMLMELSVYVASVNIHHGIQNSLDAKLDAALSALESVSHNDRPAAANALQAFINHTQAQSGNHIPPEVATELVARAEAIIALLNQ